MEKELGYFIEERRPLPIQDALTLLSNLARAFEALHSKGEVWDLSEASILVDDSLKIQVNGTSPLSSSGIPESDRDINDVVRLDVFPPEFLENRRHDAAGDVYALGVLGFEMVTGQSPFQAETVAEQMKKRMELPPPPPIELREDCPTNLSETIVRALQKVPEDRFQNMKDFLSAIGSGES